MDTDDRSSRHRLLNAAAEVFGECGYKGATIREICRRAGVGVALVNYHFRDKQGLYIEVYRGLFTHALKQYPPDMGLGENPGERERLYAFIRSFLYRLTMVGSRHSLIVREMLDPSPALVKIHNDMANPLHKLLSEILSGLFGPGVSRDDINHCALIIIGQCLFYSPHTLHFRRHVFPADISFSIEMIAEYITAFSIGGIEAIKTKDSTMGWACET